MSIPRRKFLQLSAATIGAVGAFAPTASGVWPPSDGNRSGGGGRSPARRGSRRLYNGEYEGDQLNRVAFPLGGIGAGMLCLEGTGALPRIKGDLRRFFSTASAYGTVGVKDGNPFFESKHGTLDIRELRYVK